MKVTILAAYFIKDSLFRLTLASIKPTVFVRTARAKFGCKKDVNSGTITWKAFVPQHRIKE